MKINRFYAKNKAMENVSSHTLHFKFNALPEKLKAEVLDFIDFLLEKEKKGKMNKKQKGARERVFRTLSEKKPLGGGIAWEDIHQERTFADVDRG